MENKKKREWVSKFVTDGHVHRAGLLLKISDIEYYIHFIYISFIFTGYFVWTDHFGLQPGLLSLQSGRTSRKLSRNLARYYLSSYVRGCICKILLGEGGWRLKKKFKIIVQRNKLKGGRGKLHKKWVKLLSFWAIISKNYEEKWISKVGMEIMKMHNIYQGVALKLVKGWFSALFFAFATGPIALRVRTLVRLLQGISKYE